MANPPSCGIDLFRFLMLRMIKLLLSYTQALRSPNHLKLHLVFFFKVKGIVRSWSADGSAFEKNQLQSKAAQYLL